MARLYTRQPTGTQSDRVKSGTERRLESRSTTFDARPEPKSRYEEANDGSASTPLPG